MSGEVDYLAGNTGLDNAGSVAQVRPLLPGTSTYRAVVTSRNALASLGVREGARRMSVDVLSPSHAVELLERVAGKCVGADPEGALVLARHCGYLPLALRIVAERLTAGTSVADLVDELASVRERLDVVVIDDDETTAVRAVFSWSYQSLSPAAARLYRLLGLITGPDIGARAVAALAGPGEVAKALTELVSAHLVQSKPGRRYQQHDLIRLHAFECAEADESDVDRRAALRRLLSWYANTAVAANRVALPDSSSIKLRLDENPLPPLEFADSQAVSRWWDAERANFDAIVRQAADLGEDELAWQLPVALFGFLLIRGGLTSWVPTHEIGLAAARRRGAVPATAWLLTALAVGRRGVRDHVRALEELDEALVLWRRAGVRWGEAWVLRDIGTAHYELGQDREAVAALEGALAMHVADADTWGEATALKYLGKASVRLGAHDLAMAHLRRALAIRTSRGDRRTIASALNDLGSASLAAGAPTAATDFATQALHLNTEIDYPHGRATTHELLGDIHATAGDRAQAQTHWHQAADLFASLNHPRATDLRARA
ncbi:tetratricopeptide repeat protein [Actinokineospora globicatena]|uniref:tetratricopeptide repeat protein n=1 Tax=Actinokineospora globicatena TaxID=103729 RepID=UPI0020A256FE|nr:tetratricopeptide repeat protein [Actinokineospora globicatena]MCP2303010.1 Tetratricopeptide repeat-containing protein [Actinokineospora globicatena]GLW79883.1 hypothetical protein Aglo01_43640 [Actinokineospora globicatena]GLW85707.1 hypothetical protein Aglo02_33470 [Actinokineospora globicatena]